MNTIQTLRNKIADLESQIRDHRRNEDKLIERNRQVVDELRAERSRMRAANIAAYNHVPVDDPGHPSWDMYLDVKHALGLA